MKRIHVTGASGAGVTTLGRALAGALAVPHLDTDDFYWLPSDPPFRHKREIPERLRLLGEALDRAPGGWALSGSLDGWGDPLVPRFDLVVFLLVPTEVRPTTKDRKAAGAVRATRRGWRNCPVP